MAAKRLPMFVDGVNRGFNKPRLVANHIHVNIRRQLLAQFHQLSLDGVGDGNRVGPGLLPDQKRNRRFSVLSRETALLFGTVLDARNIAEINRRSADGRNDHLIEVTTVTAVLLAEAPREYAGVSL